MAEICGDMIRPSTDADGPLNCSAGVIFSTFLLVETRHAQTEAILSGRHGWARRSSMIISNTNGEKEENEKIRKERRKSIWHLRVQRMSLPVPFFHGVLFAFVTRLAATLATHFPLLAPPPSPAWDCCCRVTECV